MPLARSRSGRVMCTSCGLDVVTAPAGSSAPQQPKSEDDEVPNGPSSAVVVPAWRPNNDALSTAIGDKLLQGWTMMNESCEDCNLPLLRDLRGRMLCVGCDRGTGTQAGPVADGVADGVVAQGGRELMRTPGVQVAANLRGLGNAVTPAVRPGSVARDPSPVRSRGMGVGGMGSERRDIPRVGGMGAMRALPEIGLEGSGLDDVEEIDVQHELWMSELEAGRRLRVVRQKMQGREDVEGIRVMAVAMQELAKAISALRDARRLEYHG